MESIRDAIPSILHELLKANPCKIILFGSLSKDEVAVGNDIDLAIVLDLDFIPKSFEEKMELVIPLHDLIVEFERKIPIDLKVFTKPEYEKLVANDHWFIREINQGKVLYELAS